MSKSPFQGLMKAGGNLPAGGGFRLALGLGALGVGASTLAYSSIFTGLLMSSSSLCESAY